MRPLASWLRKLAAGIAGEIWLKSAGLTSQLTLAFATFLQGPRAVDRCDTKIAKNLMNNRPYTVYCL